MSDRVTLRELEARYAREQATARADAHRRVDELFDRQAAQQRAEFERLASAAARRGAALTACSVTR